MDLAGTHNPRLNLYPHIGGCAVYCLVPNAVPMGCSLNYRAAGSGVEGRAIICRLYSRVWEWRWLFVCHHLQLAKNSLRMVANCILISYLRKWVQNE